MPAEVVHTATANEGDEYGESRLTPDKAVGSRTITPTRKKLVRRTERDRSQSLRRGFQIAFVLLNVWLGWLFFSWVRFYENAGQGAATERPAGVEGWLPIVGLLNLKYRLLTGHVSGVHPAAMFLLVAFLVIAFMFRKAFCSWLCPIGTLSEALWRAGRKLFRRNLRLPKALDIPLRGLKYLLLGFFVWAVIGMSSEAISDFLTSPYGVIADVKMLNFFRYLGTTATAVLLVLAVASMMVQNFWCRFLCPYGALLGLASLASPLRIRREAEPCIDCGKCAKACPSSLRVDKLVTIKSAECTGCLECVAVCPAEGALQMSLPLLGGETKKRRVPAWAFAAGVALVFLGTVAYAKVTGQWKTNVPQYVYMQLVPHANEAGHPMPGE